MHSSQNALLNAIHAEIQEYIDSCIGKLSFNYNKFRKTHFYFLSWKYIKTRYEPGDWGKI